MYCWFFIFVWFPFYIWICIYKEMINRYVWDHLCKTNIYLSWSTSELRVRFVSSNMFKPSSNFLTDRLKAMLLLWILFIICVSCHIVLYVLAALWSLLGKNDLLALLHVMFFCVFVTFPYGVLGQVGYLIVWITDICLLPHLELCLLCLFMLTQWC